MVDYSKWDNLDVSDDEETKPRVQKFEKPQSVTIGGKDSDGVVRICPWKDAEEYDLSPPEAKVDAMDDEDNDEPMEPADEDVDLMQEGEDHREEVLECRGLAERALRDGNPEEAVRLLEKALRMGGADCPGLLDVLESAKRKIALGASSTAVVHEAPRPAEPPSREEQLANGGIVDDRYCWSQTRETVEVNVFVEDGTKAKAVAVKVTDINVNISIGGKSIFSGEWPYKVAPEEDPDWELRNFDGRRAVRLTVRKPPLPGGLSIVTWWRGVLKGDPTIEVEDIKDRTKERNESFAKAWKEANIGFRESVKNHKPIPIPVNGHIVPKDEVEDSTMAS